MDEEVRTVFIKGIEFVISKVTDGTGHWWVKLTADNYRLPLGEEEEKAGLKSEEQRDSIIEIVIRLITDNVVAKNTKVINKHQSVDPSWPTISEKAAHDPSVIYMRANDSNALMDLVGGYLKSLPANPQFMQAIQTPGSQPEPAEPKPAALITEKDKPRLMPNLKLVLVQNLKVEKFVVKATDKHKAVEPAEAERYCNKARRILDQNWDDLQHPLFKLLAGEIITEENVALFKKEAFSVDTLLDGFRKCLKENLNPEIFDSEPQRIAIISTMVATLTRHFMENVLPFYSGMQPARLS